MFRTALAANAASTLEKPDARRGKPISQDSLVSTLDHDMLALMRAAFEETAERR